MPLVLVVRCTWSLQVQQWQICVAVLQVFLKHIRRCSGSCGSRMLQNAKFLDAGMERSQTVNIRAQN